MRRGIQEPTQARFACMEGLKQVLVDCVRLTPTKLEKVKVRYKYLKDQSSCIAGYRLRRKPSRNEVRKFVGICVARGSGGSLSALMQRNVGWPL